MDMPHTESTPPTEKTQDPWTAFDDAVARLIVPLAVRLLVVRDDRVPPGELWVYTDQQGVGWLIELPKPGMKIVNIGAPE
jgi:hypothetical protein